MNRTAKRITVGNRIARPSLVGHSSNVIVLKRKPKPKPPQDDFPYQLLWEDGVEILWEDGDSMLYEYSNTYVPDSTFLADDGSPWQFDDGEYVEADV